MNEKALLKSAAILLLLVGVSTIFVSSAYAQPGEAPGPPPPWDPPTTPEPPGDDGGDSGDNKKSTSIITQIFKVVFDTPTMKDAIVNSLESIFDEAFGTITTDSSPLYKMGGEISVLVFRTDKLQELRFTSWKQLRKVAFALLPLVAALTIWASMKEGLYSVTGYANTFEAVAEFFVSIAIALASYWLMEQAIELTRVLTLAISESLQLKIEASVFSGLVIKSAGFGAMNTILAMIVKVLGFALVLTYMGTGLIAFLSREVVILLTVALAPLMIILGSVRPLSWLRGLWFKAFIVFLLLLPINVLVMGVSFQLMISATDYATSTLAGFFQLLVVAGTISLLIAVNGILGKLVYGAAMEVAQKVGESVAAVGSLAVAAAGGVGALLGGAGAAAGTAPVVAGGGGTGGSMALATTGGGSVTSTSQLTERIGNVLSSSRNGILRSMGGGLKAGNAIRDHKLTSAAGPSPEPSPQLNIGKNGVPGFDKGLEDTMAQIDTPEKARALGSNQETLDPKLRQAATTTESAITAAEEAGLSGKDHFSDAGYLTEGNPDVVLAGREMIRSEASGAVLGTKSVFRQTELPKWTPRTQSIENLDFLVAGRIVQHEQKFPGSPFNKDVTPKEVGRVARAVQARRVNGGSYRSIISSAQRDSNLKDWVDTTEGLQV